MGQCTYTIHPVTGVHSFIYRAAQKSEALRFRDWVTKNCQGFKVVTHPSFDSGENRWEVKSHFIQAKWAILAKLAWVE